MEKELALQCVPAELIGRLKALAARLWEDKNPASVQLNAVLEEFEPDVKTLGHIIGQYDADYAGRLGSKEKEFAQREGRLKEELETLTKRFEALEGSHAAGLRKIAELKSAVNERDTALAELKVKMAEDEAALNTKYVAKMQELYEKINRKELDMLARWEEKNKGIDGKTQSLESDYAAKLKQIKLREKAMDEDFIARKAELIKTFDKIKAGLDAREKALAEREAAVRSKGGAL